MAAGPSKFSADAGEPRLDRVLAEQQVDVQLDDVTPDDYVIVNAERTGERQSCVCVCNIPSALPCFKLG